MNGFSAEPGERALLTLQRLDGGAADDRQIVARELVLLQQLAHLELDDVDTALEVLGAATKTYGHNWRIEWYLGICALRNDEPEEFGTAIGVGVAGLVPDLAAFWHRYVAQALADGEIHPETDVDEAAEWVARVLISLGSVPGNHLDADDAESVRRHFRRYVLPALRSRPSD